MAVRALFEARRGLLLVLTCTCWRTSSQPLLFDVAAGLCFLSIVTRLIAVVHKAEGSAEAVAGMVVSA